MFFSTEEQTEEKLPRVIYDIDKEGLEQTPVVIGEEGIVLVYAERPSIGFFLIIPTEEGEIV